MKDLVMKILPVVVGLALGFMLFEGQSLFSGLGAAGIWVLVGVLLGVFVAFVGFLCLQALPKAVDLKPAGIDPGDPKMADWICRCRALGFREAGPLYRVEINPPALLQSLVHGTEPVYAAIFRTGTLPAVVGIDFVSILDGDRGGLTTNPDRRGGTLPGDVGSLRQLLPGAEVEALFQSHLQGVAYLASRGLPCRPVSAERFPADLRLGIERQRRAYLANPVKNTLIAIFRAVTLQSPYVGPIQNQKEAERQIRALLSGVRP
ncbi:MAG: hypothetical protein KA419_06195 [Acidobacteria bacterium]|nr:hypothetical protein [Acidobacteriota bacterium]